MSVAAHSKLHHFKRRLAAVSRLLHIYLSMFSFMLLLFFAVTGLTLNHAEWFSGAPRTTHAQGTLDPQWLKAGMAEDAARTAIVEHLGRAQGIHSSLSEFRMDDAQCELSFKGPGYVAEVSVERGTGKYTITETRMGLAAVLNDLHKGRDSGRTWSAIIDVSAVLMTLVSATGLILIFFLRKRLAWGLVALAIGAVLCYVVYVVWVP
jgi:uncharacterized protein